MDEIEWALVGLAFFILGLMGFYSGYGERQKRDYKDPTGNKLSVWIYSMVLALMGAILIIRFLYHLD